MPTPLPPPDPAFRWTTEAWGPALRCVPLEASAQHLFTTKQPQLPVRVMRVRQVHGNTVRVIGRGRVTEKTYEEKPDADAMVSNAPGITLAVMVADCVPIVMAAAGARAAAAIHAGWRGTCARIAAAAVETMTQEFGARPEDMIAAIGPSIGPGDYEVGESLVDAFLAAGHPRADVERWFSRTTPKPHLDLWSANRDQLLAAGLKPDRIFVCGLSTLAYPDLFDSYRAAGERAGRMAALITVP